MLTFNLNIVLNHLSLFLLYTNNHFHIILSEGHCNTDDIEGVEFSQKVVMNNSFVKINCGTGYSNVHEYRKCVESKLEPNNDTYPFKCYKGFIFE